MHSPETAKQNSMSTYIWRSILLLTPIFLVSLVLLTTALRPFVWMPSSGGMPSRLSGGGTPPPGDCAAMFKSYDNFVKPPLFGKPVDCTPVKGNQTFVFVVALEEGTILIHDEFGVGQDALKLSILITVLCAFLLWVVFVRKIKPAYVSNTLSL